MAMAIQSAATTSSACLKLMAARLTISDVTLTGGKASRGGAIRLKNGGLANVADVAFIENSRFSAAQSRRRARAID